MKRWLVVLTVVALAVALSSATVAQRQADQDAQPAVAESPRFDLVVYQVQDPYAGTMNAATELDPSMRYVGAEVAIVNHSDVPLTTGRSYVRLRDDAGRDYVVAPTLGTETALQNRVLVAGETARGWVWYAVPVNAEISHIYLVPSALEVSLPWDEAPTGTPEATPSVDAPAEATPNMNSLMGTITQIDPKGSPEP